MATRAHFDAVKSAAAADIALALPVFHCMVHCSAVRSVIPQRWGYTEHPDRVLTAANRVESCSSLSSPCASFVLLLLSQHFYANHRSEVLLQQTRWWCLRLIRTYQVEAKPQHARKRAKSGRLVRRCHGVHGFLLAMICSPEHVGGEGCQFPKFLHSWWIQCGCGRKVAAG